MSCTHIQELSVDRLDYPVVHLIEDDPAIREALCILFEADGWAVHDYHSAETFLSAARPSDDACIVLDMMLPGKSGVEVLEVLRSENVLAPAIMLTGRSDADTAVAALKAGAADYIQKPFDPERLLTIATAAVENAREARSRQIVQVNAKRRFDSLTHREREVLLMVANGAPNKIIAADLGISQRTVEIHRAGVMRKSGAKTLPDLIKLFLAV